MKNFKLSMVYDVYNWSQLALTYYGIFFINFLELKDKILSNKMGKSVNITHMEKALVLWEYSIKVVDAIIVKWAKNHVGQSQNCQLCHTYLCNATLMLYWSKKLVLNDLYECWFF